ncbi:prolyl oligopeptidase family serine peptidase [Fervidobacterium islandicum]|uniref:Prolyl oligopeptidase family serine peptidase n=1 Tax=Fervidobacterium islandicum TaxID=2423 RepID=A0AAI8GE30_FERIS|nr:prolyl oligopeptidase family serine peptidase [Fervidobacterium islandicum]AMW33646.2 prolyl oligopeptidase family serine peptidase [Fervidobacterium islandicum]
MSEKINYLDVFKPFVYKDEFIEMPYRLFVPENMKTQEKYPLVVFLHGAGERGRDNAKQILANEGATVWASEDVQQKHPCFVLAPQCPENAYWGTSFRTSDELEPNSLLLTVVLIVDKVIHDYPVDTERIYITGLSMGGFGTVGLLTLCPEKFAAAVVVCGGGNVKKVHKISHIPIWFFHAEDDDVVPVKYSRDLVEALEKLGAPVRYTEYPKGFMASLGSFPHASWIPAYRDKEMIEWVFSHRKVKR